MQPQLMNYVVIQQYPENIQAIKDAKKSMKSKIEGVKGFEKPKSKSRISFPSIRLFSKKQSSLN
jgi:hypothetical protein